MGASLSTALPGNEGGVGYTRASDLLRVVGKGFLQERLLKTKWTPTVQMK